MIPAGPRLLRFATHNVTSCARGGRNRRDFSLASAGLPSGFFGRPEHRTEVRTRQQRASSCVLGSEVSGRKAKQCRDEHQGGEFEGSVAYCTFPGEPEAGTVPGVWE